jgi:hypothetical protein
MDCFGLTGEVVGGVHETSTKDILSNLMKSFWWSYFEGLLEGVK